MNRAQLKKRVLAQDWYNKGFEGSTFSLHVWQRMFELQNPPFYKARFNELMTITTGGRCEWFWNRRDLLAIRKWFVSEISRDWRFAERLVNKWNKKMAAVRRVWKELDRLDFKKLTDRELVYYFKKLHQAHLQTVCLSVLTEGFSLEAEQWLGKLLKKHLPPKKKDNYQEYFAKLAQSTRPSFIQEASLAKKSGLNSRTLAKKYFWIHFNYLHVTPLTEKFFAKWRPEHLPDFKAIAREKAALTRQLKLPRSLQNIFRAADLLSWWQDRRKGNVLIVTYWLVKLLREAGRRHGLTDAQLLRSLPTEFEKIANGDRSYLKELKARKDPILAYAHRKTGYVIICGKEAQAILDRITRQESQQIKGYPTYLGKASGKVVLLKSITDMKLFRAGNVLVTSMTRPEYTPILNKAAAIVTDEGGITSHAAVISREFKIPCIIGTKNATKLLKTGDRVEVDATNGVVKIL